MFLLLSALLQYYDELYNCEACKYPILLNFCRSVDVGLSGEIFAISVKII